MSHAYATELDDDRHLAARLGTVTAIIYAGSFFLPAFGGIGDGGYGFVAFIYAFAFYWAWPMWAANPIFWFGLVKLFNGRWDAAVAAGILALLLSLSELYWFWSIVNVGYFAWVASMATLAWAGLYGGLHATALDDEVSESSDTSVRVLR